MRSSIVWAALYAGLGLLLLWLARQTWMVGTPAAGASVSAPPSARPVIGADVRSRDNPFACSSRTLQQYNLGTLAPLQPTPEGSEWRGCWPGYVGIGSDSGGATVCKNAYNGTTAPPQRFRRTGQKWYGCTFDAQQELWNCPSCTV